MDTKPLFTQNPKLFTSLPPPPSPPPTHVSPPSSSDGEKRINEGIFEFVNELRVHSVLKVLSNG
ncbi:hypothetical protein C5167_043446 [Papaver somniferum]|uniref:Uncharacterized protein n=1 Tax=Papaver somniferum TaxID=3469 RepID=A0A4Y7L7F9_PAPSO|nr:hypothetical protein C5167_043446 [Papaver somniferum]